MKGEKEIKNTKKVKRSNVKYPALVPELNLKTRHDEIADIASYVDQLNEQELEWINRFVEEEIIVNYDHEGEKLNCLTNLPKNERSPEERLTRKRLNLKNNARNRCIYTQEMAQGTMNYLADLEEKDEDETLREEYKDEFY